MTKQELPEPSEALKQQAWDWVEANAPEAVALRAGVLEIAHNYARWGYAQGYMAGLVARASVEPSAAPADLWTCDECAGPPRPYDQVQCVMGNCKPVRTSDGQ